MFNRVRTLFQKWFSRTFPGLFQDSDWFFKGSKIHIHPYTPKISMLILLTAFLTHHIFWLSFTDFQNFPGPVAFFQDFPVLENATMKFQDFPGFPRPVRTLVQSGCSHWEKHRRNKGSPSLAMYTKSWIHELLLKTFNQSNYSHTLSNILQVFLFLMTCSVTSNISIGNHTVSSSTSWTSEFSKGWNCTSRFKTNDKNHMITHQ